MSSQGGVNGMSRYLAFISYRHREPDQQVSTALLRGLEGYHLPEGCGLPASRRVFRDTDELPTGIDLGANIETALEESEWLIALCSKEYLESQWCRLEIEHFIRLGRKERILPVLLSDTPETAVPEIIRSVPLAFDLRGEDLKYDRKKLSGIVPAVLARMAAGSEPPEGQEKKEPLQADDFAAAEQGFRLRVSSGIAACVLAGILGFAAYALHTAGLIAEGNARIAEATEQTVKARQTAEEERNEALLKNAQFVAEQAMAEYNAGNDDEAIRLALSVLPGDPDNSDIPVSMEALGVLRMAMSRPQDTYKYKLKSAAETDFEITGYSERSVQELLLFGEDISETATLLKYDTGELLKSDREAWQQAFEEGYSRGYEINETKVCCGPEQPAKIGRKTLRTADGKEFYMDSFVKGPLGEMIFAWLEHPLEGQEQKAALFSVKNGEAVAEIPLEGAPLCADFSKDYDYKELAVVDQRGILRLFDTKTGKTIKEIPGQWSAVCCMEADFYRICAAAADGSGWSIIDTGSGETALTVETPSPVRQMIHGYNKSALLVRCDDGARIYDLESGKLLCEVLTEEAPRFVLWGGADGGKLYSALSDGNTLVFLFRKRAEVWTLETEADTDLTEAIPLYKEGIYNFCEQAFYSKDGKKVFLQMQDGTIEAFDAGNGEFLWANEGAWNISASHSPSILSDDGRAILRRNGNYMDRIDVDTGKTQYSIDLPGGMYTVEDPVTGLGVVTAAGWAVVGGFDLFTGEVLWEDKNNLGPAIFSEDGRNVLRISLSWEREKNERTCELCFRRQDSFTGEIKEEKCLLRLKNSDDHYSLVTSPRERYACVYAEAPFSEGHTPAGTPVYVVDLEKGELSAVVPSPDPGTKMFFPAEGGMALRWMDEETAAEGWTGWDTQDLNETGYTLCCRLEPDGTLGETMSGDTEKGRRLLAEESQLVQFAGEDAVLENECRRLRRLSDNALILEVGEDYHIAATPAGGSVCVYSDKSTKKITPVLLLDSDPPTLIRKAKKRLEVQP